MRWYIAFIFMLVFAGVVRADDDTRQAQTVAATANAVNNMVADIQAEKVTASITVNQFLEKTGSTAQLLAIVQQAQQIGGPRWIGDQTCQVRLELSGSAIAKQLVDIAAANPKTTPISADELARDIRAWDTRVFTATGTSTARIDTLRPPQASQAWKNVSDEEVRKAVAAARQSAVNRVLSSIAAVGLPGDKKIADALAIPDFAAAMAGWLSARPVTMVEFREDRTVEISLSVSAAEVFAKVRTLVDARKDINIPKDEKAWSTVADGICRSMATAVGRAGVVATTQPIAAAIFTQPPDWVEKQLDVPGTAKLTNSKLRTARLAENDALAKLREQVLALPAGEGVTLAAAAQHDPKLIAAVDRAIHGAAHVYTVDYHDNGDVTVRVSLDLRLLWEQIAATR